MKKSLLPTQRWPPLHVWWEETKQYLNETHDHLQVFARPTHVPAEPRLELTATPLAGGSLVIALR